MIAKLKGIEIDLRFGILDRTPSESYINTKHSRLQKGNTYIYINKDQIVGALVIRRSRSGKTVWSCGTIVRSSYRKKGIARKLWTQMLREEKPKRVIVSVISDKGYSLIESVKDDFPKVRWSVSQNGKRKLRRLK